MAFRDQLMKLRDNWLLVALIILILFFTNFQGITQKFSADTYSTGYGESRAMSMPGISQDFAPDIEERLLTKTANLQTETARGAFHNTEEQVKTIIQSVGGFVLNENVNKFGTDNAQYYHGNYQLKVTTSSYPNVVRQLKELGEVQSFGENTADITGQNERLQTELQTEEQRLIRFQAMYNQAKNIEDQVLLTDRIFDIERRISYLQQQTTTVDQQVSYSTIYLTLTEKQSNYANTAFVTFSKLVNNFVSSFNGLITVLVMLLPWIVVILILKGLLHLFRKN